MLYRKAVLRVLLLLVLALLIADASGAASLMSPEECTALSDTMPDGNCPALCVRCACCAQIVVPVNTQPPATVDPVITPLTDTRRTGLASGSPHDILHVPK